MTIYRGALITALTKLETTYGVAPAGNWAQAAIYSDELEEQRGIVDDPLLSQPRNNDGDQLAGSPDLPKTGNQIVAPLDLIQAPWWLELGFGAPVTTPDEEDPINYTRVYKSGLSVLPSRSWERKNGAGDFSLISGLMVDKITLNLQRAAGFDQATLDCLFHKETPLDATGGGAPTALARDPLPKVLPVVKLGIGDAGALVAVERISTATAIYDNKLSERSEVGFEYVPGYDKPQFASLGGVLTMRLTSDQFNAFGRSRTKLPMQFLWSKSDTRFMQWDMPAIQFEQRGKPVKGPDGVDVDFNWRAEQTVSDAMLSVTLANGIASYV